MREEMLPQTVLPSVLTGTGLDIHRYICNGSYVTMPAVRASPVAGTTACNGRGLDLGNQMAARLPALLDLGRYPGAALGGRTPHP